MHRGYIKLWRKSFDSTVWQNNNLWRLWTYCLMKATHKPLVQLVGYKNISLNPGQFIFGRQKASLDTGLTEQCVRTCMNKLRNAKKLTINSTKQYSVVSINNWERYQMEVYDFNQEISQQLTNEQPTTNQQLTTNKKHKKHKNIYTSDFLTFWECYPKKVGKGGAARAWDKARDKPPIADLVAAVERQSKSDQWKRDNGQYIPNPQTWLNQRRWEDGETDKPSPRYINPYMKKYLESLKK